MSLTKNPAGPPPAAAGRKSITLSGQQINEVGLFAALILAVIFFSVFTDNFASVNNFWSILNAATITGIVAWAATLIIVSGEIDISVGPAVAFWGVILAELLSPKWGFNLATGMIVTLLLGALVGAFAGWLRARWGVPSFIVTLGLWLALRGLAQSFSGALPVQMPRYVVLKWLGGKMWAGGPDVAAVIMVVLFLVFVFISRNTTYGRSVFAIGGNARAALLTGIKVARIRVILFATSGLFAALLGIILAARLGSGNSGTAVGLEFDVIAAVVVGGTALQGGRGSMLGTLLGALFIAVIGNGLIVIGVDQYLQSVVQGALIVGAVLINMALGNRGGQRS